MHVCTYMQHIITKQVHIHILDMYRIQKKCTNCPLTYIFPQKNIFEYENTYMSNGLMNFIITIFKRVVNSTQIVWIILLTLLLVFLVPKLHIISINVFKIIMIWVFVYCIHCYYCWQFIFCNHRYGTWLNHKLFWNKIMGNKLIG